LVKGEGCQNAEFDRILLDAVDGAFSILGENVKISIYFNLRQKFNITKNEIPSKLGEFSDALEKIFGIGARHIELLVMQKLHEKLGRLYKWKDTKSNITNLTFENYVNMMKCNYEKTVKDEKSASMADPLRMEEQKTFQRAKKN